MFCRQLANPISYFYIATCISGVSKLYYILNSLFLQVLLPGYMHINYILLKALPRVCTENTARGACREINAARGEAECCIYLKTCPRVLYFSYTQAKAVL